MWCIVKGQLTITIHSVVRGIPAEVSWVVLTPVLIQGTGEALGSRGAASNQCPGKQTDKQGLTSLYIISTSKHSYLHARDGVVCIWILCCWSNIREDIWPTLTYKGFYFQVFLDARWLHNICGNNYKQFTWYTLYVVCKKLFPGTWPTQWSVSLLTWHLWLALICR